MKDNKKSQQSQSGKAGDKKNQERKSSNPTQGARRNADISAGDRGEEPTPPIPNPDTPPKPSRKEYEDPDHEHTYHPPKAPGKHQFDYRGE